MKSARVMLKDLTLHIGVNSSENVKEEKVKQNDSKVWRVEEKPPYIILYKASYIDEKYGGLYVLGRGRHRTARKEFKQAYVNKPSISKRKNNDLIRLCRVKHIPAPYNQFYESLL